MSLRALGLSLCLLTVVALAQDEAAVDTVDPKVMAVYQEGKSAYDAKNFTLALEKFDRCVELDPSRARWHYNRGLALKKLKRDAEAREAFADSRRMDPSYKKAEIDQKLSELGDTPAPSPAPSPASSSSASISDPFGPLSFLVGLLVVVGCLGLPFGFVVWLVRRLARQAESSQKVPPPARSVSFVPLREKLESEAARLAPLEHGVAGNEAAFAAVDAAGTDLQFARYLVMQGHDAAAATAALQRAAKSIDVAAQQVGASSAHGERVGCFFCARPLALASARRGVEISAEDGKHAVVACERCAKKAAAGQPLTVRTVEGPGGQQVHWSEAPQFDPYLHAYSGGPASRDVPAWKANLSGERLSSMAPLVGLGAVGAGAAAVGLFDLLSARESGQAEEAAAAAAAAAASSRSSSGSGAQTWRDHS